MLAGVIGWPVEHSRSPAIHLAAAAATGVDLAYTRFAVAPGDGERQRYLTQCALCIKAGLT